MHLAPKETLRFIKRYGGTNPYGHPNWRLVVAADVLVKEAGVWRDWAEGLTTAEKGGLNFSPSKEVVGMNFQRYDNKPIRVVTEVRETPKYPESDGWILERWFPASSYGTRQDWHSYKSVDGITPMLGPYPEEGSYEMQYGPWLKTPAISTIQALISSYTNQMAHKRGTPESRAQEYLMRFQYQYDEAEKKRKAEYTAMMKDELTPMHSSSLAASRWRNRLAENAGISEHIGIL